MPVDSRVAERHVKKPLSNAAQLLLVCVVLLPATVSAQQSEAEEVGQWGTPINLSESNTASYYPDIAVDSAGHIYVVWGEFSPKQEEVGWPDMLMLRISDGEQWTTGNDVAVGAHLPQIGVDSQGRLHLLRVGEYIRTWAQHDPSNARSWVPGPNWAFRSPYWPDMLVDNQDRVHVIFRDTREYEEARTIDSSNRCATGCRGIFYTRSVDGGETWSKPLQVDTQGTDAEEPRLAVDKAGTIYAVWSDTDALERTAGVSFAYSSDGGETWSYPVQVATQAQSYAAPQIAVDSLGIIHIVWHLEVSQGRGNVAYVFSGDHGDTWSQVEELPMIWAGAYSLGLAVDSANTLHMVLPLAGGDYPLGIYHLQRPAGGSWSSPAPVSRNPCNAGSADVELTISEGNHLHAVWYDRQECELGFVGPSGRGEVYYSSFVSDAPPLESHPLPSAPTPLPEAAPTATSVLPEATSTPASSPIPWQANDDPVTENPRASGGLPPLLLGIGLPLTVMMAVAVVARFRAARR